MKICLVSPYDWLREGGVNQVIKRLAVQYRAAGHTVKIFAPANIDPDEPPPAGLDPDVYPLGSVVPIRANGSVARITLSLNISKKIKAILQDEQFDVIHIHEPLQPALPLTVIAHAKATTVGTFHAFAQSHVGYYYMRPILRYFILKLDGRTVVSRPALDFISQYFRGSYEIIPNGIDLSRFEQTATPLPEFMDGQYNILFVGRFGERRKGLKHLLRAYLHVQRELPNSRLIIVGRGKEAGYRRFLERHNIKNVVFAGFVSDEDLPRYHASSHVFCAPSTGGESFGIVLLEAMASGLPIVASDIPGYASVLEHNVQGVLVEPKNSESLAMALIHLLADAGRRERMGEAARLKAAEYSWEKVAQRYLDFYEWSMGRRRARQRLQRIRRSTRRRTYGLGWLARRRRSQRLKKEAD